MGEPGQTRVHLTGNLGQSCGLYWQSSALQGLSNILSAKLAALQSVPLFVIKIKVCLETSDNCMQVKTILSGLTEEQKNVELERENGTPSSMNWKVEAGRWKNLRDL